MSQILRDQHDELRRLMRRFATAMASPAGFDHADLRSQRVAFSRFFTQHLQAEHAAVQALAPDALSSAAAEAVAAYKARLAQLRLDYSVHISNWPPDLANADWPAYVAGVQDLQRRLHALLEWEDRVLLPLLPAERADEIRRLPSAA